MLDAGEGAGDVSELLIKNNLDCNYLGIDISHNSVKGWEIIIFLSFYYVI